MSKTLAWILLVFLTLAPKAAMAEMSVQEAITRFKSNQPPTSPTQLIDYADQLTIWNETGHAAGLMPTMEQYRSSVGAAVAIYRAQYTPQTKDFHLMWKFARGLYYLGEMTALEKVKERDAIYIEILSVVARCIVVNPKVPVCWLFQAIAHGRLATQSGILSNISRAPKIEESFQMALTKTQELKLGDIGGLTTSIYKGLSDFYRLMPDSTVVSIATGIRGNIDRSIEYANQAVKLSPNNVESQLELASALICKGERDDDAPAHTKGLAIIKGILAGKFDQLDVRLLDQIDKNYAKQIDINPELACGFSRAGFQDL